MSAIDEANKFSNAGIGLNINRSRFDRNQENILTFKAGDIVPMYWDEVLPGDTVKIGYDYVMRMLTPVTPVMDNAYLDIYAFYVPNRVLCEKYNLTDTAEGVMNSTAQGDWETFMGENKSGYWAPDKTTYLNTYYIPFVAPQSVANYLGLPIGNGCYTAGTILKTQNSSGGWSVNSVYPMRYNNYQASQYKDCRTAGVDLINGLPFAALDLIYNEWFRNETVEAPTMILQTKNLTYSTDYGSTTYNSTAPLSMDLCGNNDSDVWNTAQGALEYPYKANKFMDYYTSCLPAPQMGDSVNIPLGDSANIVWGSDATGLLPIVTNLTYSNASKDIELINGVPYSGATADSYGYYATTRIQSDDNSSLSDITSFEDEQGDIGIEAERITNGTYVDLSSATAATINNLRVAFQTQKFLEKMARGGNRYCEILKSMYGTSPDDSTLQRPEYLGGKRMPITVTQVTNTAQTSEGDLGEMGAFSNTIGHDEYLVNKSFQEHGILMVVGVVRTANKYFQGIERKFTRYRQLDYYFPTFANIGEQAVTKSQIYVPELTSTLSSCGTWASSNTSVLGYQEAWAEYRYSPDKLTGFTNPDSGDATLASWTFQTGFAAAPTLNEEFEKQSYEGIANVLYDTTTISQFLMDINFECEYTRPMPVYSIPGGI